MLTATAKKKVSFVIPRLFTAPLRQVNTVQYSRFFAKKIPFFSEQQLRFLTTLKDDNDISLIQPLKFKNDKLSLDFETGTTSEKNIDYVFKNIEDFFKKTLGIANGLDYEQTTGSDTETQAQTDTSASSITKKSKKHSKKQPPNYVKFGNAPSKKDKNYRTKIYRKGLTDKAGNLFMGIKVMISEDANNKKNPYSRKNWTPLQKGHLPIKIDPKTGISHRSHALANCFFGAETAINIATATLGVKRFLGQGEAQGILEKSIYQLLKNDVYKGLKDPEKDFDLRFKITDYCDENNLLLKRRIKVCVNHIQEEKKQEQYSEITLGEFFLDGDFMTVKNSPEHNDLKDAVKKLEENAKNYIEIIKDTKVSDIKNTQFWKNEGFKVCDRHFDVSDTIITSDNADVTRIEENISALKTGKKNRTDIALNPIMFFEDKFDGKTDKLEQELKTAYASLGDDKKVVIMELLNGIQDSMNLFKATPNLFNKKQQEKQIMGDIYDLFKHLKNEKIISPESVRQFLPQKLSDDNTQKAVHLHHTPITEVVCAILRMND